jgi:hypothetical protein
MERQKPTNQIRHHDDFSKALIESTAAYFTGIKSISEEGIPSLEKKTNPDDFSRKDPKAKANPSDPAVVLNTDLKTGRGVKQSHGATIKYTNVVATEEVEKKEKEKDEGGKHKEYKHAPGKEEKGEKKTEKEMKETFNLEVDGVHYVFEKKNAEGKEQGADGKACWKGYKYAGTDGGKDKCVKEEIGTIELDEKAPPGAKYERMVKHVKKGYAKDGELTKKEKGISYATAWKAKGKKENYNVDAANQLWSEVGERLGKLGEMDNAKFKVIGEKMDPVGKEDKDIDNDGDHDKSDKYLAARRKKIGKVLSAKKKMSERYEIEKEIAEEKK